MIRKDGGSCLLPPFPHHPVNCHYLSSPIFNISSLHFLIPFLVCGSRLWAEIFEVREEGGDICWARVSDDVVPVNITCIQDTPDTVFQITAYNRHVEKIFDVRLIQPGERKEIWKCVGIEEDGQLD